MGLYYRLCKRFFAAVIIRLTAQSDSRALIAVGRKRNVCVCVFLPIHSGLQ